MKFTFTTQEFRSVEKLIVKLGVESQELRNILYSLEDGETQTINADDFEVANMLSKELRDEINSKCGHIMTITRFDSEYQIWLCDKFFTETVDLYSDFIVEIIRGLQGIAKSMAYFVRARFMPFLEKWNLK